LTQHALPLKDEVTLLMASAPWVEEQFESKGIDILLRAAAQDRRLKLILLWRGLLLDKLLDRIQRLGVEDRVEVVTERVNVNNYLRRAHAAVMIAKRGDMVKSYPHSLIESLVAGKPVVLTSVLSMADYVGQQDCGIVLDDVSVPGLLGAIETLNLRYATLSENARRIESHVFSEGAMIENYRRLYRLR
jgi:glycosyltransferase involved in cell wall biosynthesis